MPYNARLPLTEQIFEISTDIYGIREQLKSVNDTTKNIKTAKKNAKKTNVSQAMLDSFMDPTIQKLHAEIKKQLKNANAALGAKHEWTGGDQVALERALEDAVKKVVKKVKKSNKNADLDDFDKALAKDKAVKSALSDLEVAMAVSVSNIAAQIKKANAAAGNAEKAHATAKNLKAACKELSDTYLGIIPYAKIAGLDSAAATMGVSFRNLIGPSAELASVTQKLAARAKTIASNGAAEKKRYERAAKAAGKSDILEKMAEKFI